MLRKIKILSIVFCGWFLLHTLLIVVDGFEDELVASDIGVVFGNKVNEDGSLSKRLTSRLDKGLELYRNGMVKRLVVSGGLGKEGHWEGSKMAEYLVSNGVRDSDILVDNFGNTTHATAVNFKKMGIDAQSVILISQYYHITRSKLAFSKEGFDKVHGVHCDIVEIRDAYALFREFFAYYKYLIY